MTKEQQIRSNLQKIQAKYYTPTSKIANDIKFHPSIVNRFINDKMTENPSDRLLNALNEWVKNRI